MSIHITNLCANFVDRPTYWFHPVNIVEVRFPTRCTVTKTEPFTAS